MLRRELLMSVYGCRLNRAMRHLISSYGEEDVENARIRVVFNERAVRETRGV